MATEKMTFEAAKQIIVKNLPDDFLKDKKNGEALSLMGLAFENFKVLSDESLKLIQESEKQQAEIERLNNNISAMAITLSNSAKETRTEAIKEFAERLKKHSYFDQKDQRKVVAEVVIDYYIKELTDKEIEQHINSDSRQTEINKNAQSLIKSFAEKLKSKLSLGLENKIPANVYSFVYVTIENLVKEMVGDDK